MSRTKNPGQCSTLWPSLELNLQISGSPLWPCLELKSPDQWLPLVVMSRTKYSGQWLHPVAMLAYLLSLLASQDT